MRAIDDVESIMNLMTEHRIRHVPVVEDGQLMRHHQHRRRGQEPDQELEKDRNELMEYITARCRWPAPASGRRRSVGG